MDQYPGQDHKLMRDIEQLKIGLPGKCPYLGIKTDPDTSFDYPSIWNTCHRTKTPEIPLLEHQNAICLTPEHTICPVFVGTKDDKFPSELIEHVQYRSRKIKYAWIVGVTLVLAILVILFLISKAHQSELSSEKLTPNSPATETTQSILIITEEPIKTEVTFLETPGLEVEQTDTTTPFGITSEVEVLHKLDVPIGTDHQFIIHQVQDGESLEQYAVQYNTDRETIIAINYYLPVPLWVNWLVIIPVDLTDPVDLPTFEAYLVTDETISITALAEKLGKNPEVLAFYNGIGADHVMKSGEWMLIPQEGYLLYNP